MNHPSNLELPMGKRKPLYRVFEILPGALSYGMLITMVILSVVNPFWASVFLLLLIMTMIIKALGIAGQSVVGHRRFTKAKQIDWRQRLNELEDPEQALEKYRANDTKDYEVKIHVENLTKIAQNQASFPKPSELYNLVIIAAYNEPYDVIRPTLQALEASTYNKKQLMIVFGYEERGGDGIEQTVMRLRDEFRDTFHSFIPVKHPANMPNEVSGKGPNITYAAQKIEPQLNKQGINLENVIVTTLDCDNKPYKSYFDYLSYEYIINEHRQRLSFQPIALYFGNIWDAPAPMRLIAIGNSFWTLVSSVRPHTLRNFAAHSQPMLALSQMEYWSKRSIVEDGHQYWRSYFFFRGDYDVVPLYVPIYQDAVLGETFRSTMVAQFKQLRRWGYGASDVPYVATRLFSRRPTAPFFPTLARFIRLVDSHVSLATVAILVAVGAWIPLIINPGASSDIAAHNLPAVVSNLQRMAMIGIAVSIMLSIRMLPPRPSRHKRRRSIWMVLQWMLMPVTAILYSAFSSFNAQTHLMFGRYLETFDVTEKVTRETAAETQSDGSHLER